MKRDMELARLILREVETCESPWGIQDNFEIEGYNHAQIAYHTKLLAEAGLISAENVSSMGPDGFNWVPGNLTWQGHDFLDATKDDSIWNKAKKDILKPGVSFTFGLLLEWLKLEAKQKLGLP